MEKNKISLIVGCGNIGFRHFQGLLSVSLKQKIYVYDISNESLKICKDYESKVVHNHEVIYSSSLIDIKENVIDLLILSTSADVRFEILKSLCKSLNFLNIILEKIVFQSIDQFNEANELFKNLKQTNVWINLIRRENNFYNNIKHLLKKDKLIKAEVYGEDWGLACNSIHFIDLVSFLISSKLKDLDMTLLKPKVFSSKRKGYIEFKGSITARFENNTILTLTSSPSNIINNKYIFIHLCCENQNISIVEGSYESPFAVFQSKVNPKLTKKNSFEIDYVSKSTKLIVDSLFLNKTCNLPKFVDVFSEHIIYNESFLKEYNKLLKDNKKTLPIT